MDYRIEEKPEMVLTGYKRFFTGSPAERDAQEEAFHIGVGGNGDVLEPRGILGISKLLLQMLPLPLLKPGRDIEIERRDGRCPVRY